MSGTIGRWSVGVVRPLVARSGDRAGFDQDRSNRAWNSSVRADLAGDGADQLPITLGLSGNPMTFERLAKEYEEIGTPLPSEVKPESFRCWMCIEFIPDVDDPTNLDARYDFWCVIVSEGVEDRIAYLEIHDPD
jgi:hypothetical protein